MSYTNGIVNPFFAARFLRSTLHPSPRHDRREWEHPIYGGIPRAPKTSSPVPHLTSLYHFHLAGNYGSRKYPGNCGGNLIKDLLRYFRPTTVFDPMSGSGTCVDVCRELGIPCVAGDLHSGFDACNPDVFSDTGTFDFVWVHLPYWRQKLYTKDPRDLSRAPTLEAFLDRYGQFIRNAAGALTPRGKLAILIGDYQDREAGFIPLTYHTKRLAFAAGLRQCSTDIIRFSHGASSGRKVYRSSFIPGLHDVCMIFEKQT